MSKMQTSMLSALRRLRAAEAPPDTSQPAPVGRHSLDTLGERAWLATQQALATLRVERESKRARGAARVIRGIRRHVSRDAYWPVEYGW